MKRYNKVEHSLLERFIELFGMSRRQGQIKLDIKFNELTIKTLREFVDDCGQV